MTFWAREWRMPSIMEAWLPASDKITQFSNRLPSVLSAAQLDT